MCLRRLRKPLVPQLKRQEAGSPGEQRLLSEMPAALAHTRASITITSLVGGLFNQTKLLRRPP